MKKILLILGILLLPATANALTYPACDSDTLAFAALAGNRDLFALITRLITETPGQIRNYDRAPSLTYILLETQRLPVNFDMYYVQFGSIESANRIWVNLYLANQNRNPNIIIDCKGKD
jgi:hypothetical protein